MLRVTNVDCSSLFLLISLRYRIQNVSQMLGQTQEQEQWTTQSVRV